LLQEDRILVVGAHPGDAIIFAGGTIFKYKGTNEIKVIALTYGERGEANEYWESHEESSIGTAKKIKAKEFQAAMNVMGINNYEILDYGDNPLLPNKEKLMYLIDKIREYKPSLVLTHLPQDPYLSPDHEITGQLVTKAYRYSRVVGLKTKFSPYQSSTKCLLYFGPYESSLKPIIYVDCTETMDIKLNAYCQFKSQKPEESLTFLKASASFYGCKIGSRFAEAFYGFPGEFLKPTTRFDKGEIFLQTISEY